MSDPPRKKISADPEARGKTDIPYHITSLRVPLFESEE